MGYTDDEVREVIGKLMLAAPRRGVDVLGVRSTGIEGGDYLEIISTTLINAPAAPWHLVKLGTARTLERVRAASSICAGLLAGIQEVDRKVAPIRDLSALATTRAALIDMDVAAGKRSTAVSTPQTPAYVRFARSVERFLGQYGDGIRRDGDIVMTPAEARSMLKSNVELLRVRTAEVEGWVTDLLGVEASFAAVNLPGRAVSGLISRSRTLLDARLNELEAKTPEARVEDLRPVVLELITAKSLITKYGAARPDISGPRTSGTGTPWSDADHLAESAFITAAGGPFPIIGARQLDLWSSAAPVKTAVAVTVSVYSELGQVQPYRAVLTRASGSFVSDGVVIGDVVYLNGANPNTRWTVQNVSAGQLTVSGSVFSVAGASTAVIRRAPDAAVVLPSSYVAEFAGSAPAPLTVPLGGLTLDFTALLDTEIPFSVALPSGVMTADDVVTAIQLEIDSAGLNGIIGVLPYASPVAFDGVVDITTPVVARFTLQSGDLTGTGIQPGDTVIIMSGVDAGKALTITTVTSGYVDATNTGIAELSGIRIQIGRGGARIRVFMEDAENSVENQYGLRLESTSTAALLLGMPLGGEVRSRASSTETVAGAIQSTLFTAVPAVIDTDTATGEMVGAATVLVYDEALTGDVTTPAANTVSVTFTGSVSTLPGDLLLLRSGPEAGSLWVVASVSGGVITATGTVTPTPTTGVTYVSGPSTLDQHETLLVNSGLNKGEYAINTTSGLFVEVTPAVPVISTPAGPLTVEVTLQTKSVRIESIDRTTASYVLASGPALSALAGVTSLEETGTTRYFKLPDAVDGLAIGDFLDFYNTTYITADQQLQIVGVEGDLIELAEPIDSVTSWPFQGPPPFAALRGAHLESYGVLAKRLSTWLASTRSTFWNDLRRAMNPLLYELNPTAVQQGVARNIVLELYAVLSRDGAAAAGTDPEATLEAALEDYQAPTLHIIDSLLRTLQDKGLDRAVDLLTRCRVKELFSVESIEELSFAGRFQAAMRAVARNDLPVRRDDRPAATRSPQVYAESDGVDYEYEPDVTPTVAVNPPATKRP